MIAHPDDPVWDTEWPGAMPPPPTKSPEPKAAVTTTTVPTFTATIYVGFKHHYDGEVIDRAVVIEAIQKYVDAVGLCVTVTDTQFVYTNGGEPGIAVGLINYPRFPSTPEAIRGRALELAEILLNICRQWKVSVVMPGETVMLAASDMGVPDTQAGKNTEA